MRDLAMSGDIVLQRHLVMCREGKQKGAVEFKSSSLSFHLPLVAVGVSVVERQE